MLWFRPSHLDEYLAQGDEGRAELSEEQAADEEIALLLSEELGDKMQKKHDELHAGMETKTQHGRLSGPTSGKLLLAFSWFTRNVLRS